MMRLDEAAIHYTLQFNAHLELTTCLSVREEEK